MTRAMAFAVALLAPLAALPSAEAQAPAGTELLQDDVGDLQLFLQGSPSGAPLGRFQAADVTSLWVEEDPERLTFVLTVASLDPSTEAPLLEQSMYRIGFVFRDLTYRVEVFRVVRPADQGQLFATLQLYDAGRADYGTLAFGPSTADPAAKTIRASFDRKLILDSDGNSPHPQMPLTDWNVATIGGPTDDCDISVDGQTSQECLPMRVADRMPNEGNGTVPLQVKHGISQTGHARLRSDTPTRSTNGEATTFVYQVEAQNDADREDTFRLTASGPGNWQVRLPASEVRIPAFGRIVFPVLVTIPFQHDHGTVKTVLVELKSESDPGTVGRIQLGVRFPQPPQPAGHHDTLTFHSRAQPDDPMAMAFVAASGRGPGLYMNADEEDPLDSGAEIAGRTCDFEPVPPAVSYCWNVPLSPGLQLGLDFDLARTGELSVPIKTTAPLLGASLSGQLLRLGTVRQTTDDQGRTTFERNVTLLATVEATPAADLAPAATGLLLTAAITPGADGDYVPYEEGASMLLQLVMTGTRIDSFFGPSTAPMVQPGGEIRLPLNEYHDKVDTVFSTNTTLRLNALGAQDRQVNPGEVALYRLELENKGGEAEVHLELTGTNAAWARWVDTQAHQTIPAGGKATVQVAVQVPADAPPGATADLVLTATQVDDLNVRTLVRLFATVDTGADHPDDAALAAGSGQEQDTPLPLVVLVAALALALARRRR